MTTDRPLTPPRRFIRRALIHSAALACALAFVLFVPAQTPPFPAPEPLFTPRSAIPDNGSPEWRPELVRVFFPPDPPPLDGATISGSTFAPAELAAYVNETFYSSLGTRLETKKLSDRLRSRLNRYRTTKLALQNELRAELDRLVAVEPTARIAELRRLGDRQTPSLVELEAMAEQLRRDLFSSNQAWGELRDWHLGDGDQRGYTPNEIAAVMRAAAYEQGDLSLVQRGLLREIAIELGTPADSPENAMKAQPYLFFSPAPARVLLPTDVSAGVATKLADYQTKKSALKKELYDAVYANDRNKFNFLHTPFKKLAAQQAGRLAALEILAEEIRDSLADFAKPPANAESLPLALQSRLSRLVAVVLTAQKDTGARIDAILATAADLPVLGTYRFDGQVLKYGFTPSSRVRSAERALARPDRTGPDVTRRMEAIRAEVAAVAEDYYDRMATLNKEKVSIRAEIEEAIGVSTREWIDEVLLTTGGKEADFYRDYRVAVFQPGLSPEQHRLLFDGAIERLELQLPRGELQPRYRRRPR